MTKILCCTCDEHCPFHGDKAHRAAENAAVLLEAAQKALSRLEHYEKNLGGADADVMECLERAISKARGGD